MAPIRGTAITESSENAYTPDSRDLSPGIQADRVIGVADAETIPCSPAVRRASSNSSRDSLRCLGLPERLELGEAGSRLDAAGC